MSSMMALYEAVMGDLWENQQVRGKAYGRIGARISGRRQGHSYAKTGRSSLRNVAKAASGQSVPRYSNGSDLGAVKRVYLSVISCLM